MFIVSFVRFLVGTVRFSASGGFPEKLLHLCAVNGITLRDVRRVDGVLYAYAWVHDYRRIRPCAKKSGMRLRIVERHGIRFFLHRYRKRAGMLAGLAAFILLLILLSSRVWTVEVRGNQALTDEEILSACTELGLYPGISKRAFDAGEIADALQLQMKELSWAAVNLRGSNVLIEVRERTVAPGFLDDRTPCNLIAQENGQIQSIEVYDGVAMVKPGDGVAKGDLLVSGVVEHQNKTVSYRHARGIITARVERTLTVEIPYQQETVVYLGEEKSTRTFEIFGLRIPLYFSGAPKEDYELEEKEDRLIISGKALPLAVYTHTYRMVRRSTSVIDKEAAMDEARRRMEQQEEELTVQAQIVSRKQEEGFLDDRCRLTVRIICDINIAVEHDIVLEHTQQGKNQ